MKGTDDKDMRNKEPDTRYEETGMKRRLYIIIGIGAAMFCSMSNTFAQSVTYSHDAAKMNQITVAEIGSGSLTPSLYYQLLHNSYRKSAAAKNKLGFRTTAGINLYNQTDDAEALDSALTQRARIEALNVADRSGGALDMAWLAEGEKINTALGNFEKNIRRITEAGGSADTQEYWRDYYNMYLCAIKSVQDAYMPNSQRKKQYLRIHADILRKNEALVRYLVRLANSTKVEDLLEASITIEDRRAQIAMAVMNRWRESGWRATGD